MLQLVVEKPEYAVGVLQIVGREFFREYGLPEHGGARAFGVGAGHLDVIPVWTTGGSPEDLTVRFFPSLPVTMAEGLQFASEVRLLAYDPAGLPVRVDSWIPYTARVRSPVPGLLETPRMFQDGYAARVDGAQAQVLKSPDGFASVALPAGDSRVELLYRVPRGLRLLFWLSSLTAVGAAAVVLSICAANVLRAGGPWRSNGTGVS